MTQKQDREIEKKYVMPSETDLARFMEDARSLRFPGLRANNFNGPLNRNDAYYDTDDFAILLTGRCLRAGARSDRSIRITFKEKTADERERIEIQDVLTPVRARAALEGAYYSRAIDKLQKKIGFKKISAKLRVYKTFHSINLNDCEVVFGYTVFAGRRGAMERIDLEIEARGKATVETVEQVGAILAPRFSLVLDMRSKYEVGMALVG